MPLDLTPIPDAPAIIPASRARAIEGAFALSRDALLAVANSWHEDMVGLRTCDSERCQKIVAALDALAYVEATNARHS